MSFTKINHYEKEYADMHHDTALNVTDCLLYTSDAADE